MVGFITNATNLTNVTNRVNRRKTLGFLDIARIMQNPQSQNPYMPPLKRVNRTWVGG